MTDLKIADIQQVLSTEGFHPKEVLCPTCARFVGLISTKVEEYSNPVEYSIAENAKEWRRYRPNGINKGKDRLTALKNCREYQKLEASPTYSSTESHIEESRHELLLV